MTKDHRRSNIKNETVSGTCNYSYNDNPAVTGKIRGLIEDDGTEVMSGSARRYYKNYYKKK